MVSNLKNIVVSVIGEHSAEMNKKAYGYESKLSSLETRADKGLADLPQIMSELHIIFRYHLTNNDYKNIEKQLSYKVK